jgi:hypothetical protein
MSKTGPLHGTRSKKINSEVVDQPSPTPSTKSKRSEEKELFSTMFPADDDEIVAELGMHLLLDDGAVVSN